MGSSYGSEIVNTADEIECEEGIAMADEDVTQ
jgi:hypothetical protein